MGAALRMLAAAITGALVVFTGAVLLGSLPVTAAIWTSGALLAAAVIAYVIYGVACELAARGPWPEHWEHDITEALSAEIRARATRLEAGLPAPRQPEHPSWGTSKLRTTGITIPDLDYCRLAA
jgi:hypothetical protein